MKNRKNISIIIMLIVSIFNIYNFSYAKSININGIDIFIDSETIKKKVAKEIEKETFSSKEESKDEYEDDDEENKQEDDKDVKDTSVKVDISITNHNPYESALVTIEEKVNVSFRRKGSKKETYTIEKGKSKDIEYKYTYNKSFVRDQIDKWFNKDYEELKGRDDNSYFYEETNEKDNIENIENKNILETDDKKLEKKASKIGIIILVIFIIIFVFIIYIMVMTKIRDKDIDIEKYLRESRKGKYKSGISSVCIIISTSLIMSMIGSVLYSNIVYAEKNSKSVIKEYEPNIYQEGAIFKKKVKENVAFNGLTYTFMYDVSIEYSNEYKISEEDYGKDSDGDLLVDALEYQYMTDINNVDSDNDGLSDYIEVAFLDYNPLSDDTYNDGKKDGDRDYDNDGLSNKEEVDIGTALYLVDTDYDLLSDYEEINKYYTDPLSEDTDEDFLIDSDEIELGLDPNNPMTDGNTLDSERKIKQSLDKSKIPNELRNGNIRISSIEGEVCGIIDNNIKIKENHNNIFDNIESFVSKPMDVICAEDSKLNIVYDVSNVSKRKQALMVVKYNDGMLEAIDTICKGDDLYAVIGSGTYGVVDSELLLREMNIFVDEYIR